MNEVTGNELEQEFLAIWRRLVAAGAGPLAVAGGQGLLLKQNWLRSAGGRILVPLERWRDISPRATKDFDLVMDLGLIGDKEAQARVAGLLKEMGYEPTDPRWKFTKNLGETRRIVVEFHAEVPEKGRLNVRGDRYRVKHYPSLDEKGIHGRTNEEASGCHLHPFVIGLADQQILLPNPVTWSVMKLTAMADMRDKAVKNQENEKERRFCEDQAKKHAVDVCRILAMTSQEEAERAGEVVAFLRGSKAFTRATALAKEYFSDDDGWGTMTTEDVWTREDHREIRDLLLGWFGEE